ncbi:hypothetical protein [Enterobacter roggenkampii]|uniref:Uncharacterized protein n=1 Tax=Enterobacter roggenkampii TaxID=1812935 RepID=A0AAX1WHH2_9ENTR|nr:hypothetical protein [Enterobacter roggenkampii]ELA2294606.1 hypothetical protein [Klebsiella pneumoniae]RNT38151.1 hypothetical protein B9059_017160 [Enterobacter roggenkampii]
MSVKRYDLVGDMDGNCNLNEARMEHSDDGSYVSYEDYAALEARCAALAAENAGLKEACGGDGSYRDCPACAHSEYIEAPETPATDAFLAEVRAQGVEAAIEHLLNKFEGTGHIGVPVMALEWLAQELRKEAAQ